MLKKRVLSFLEKKNKELQERLIIPTLKDKNEFESILSQMEKLVQGKIDALKSSVPIFFTVITSVIAFFFLDKFKLDMDDTSQIKTWLMIFGVGLVLLLLLLIGNFSIYRYKSSSQSHLHATFKPWDISTYVWVGDEEFVTDMEKYAGRELTESEIVRVNMLKEKINEFRKKNICMCIVLSVIMFFLLMFIFGIVLYGSSL